MSAIDSQSDKKLRESLSALMDNEASELEVRRVLNRLEEDESFKKTAFNYRLIGETIRKKTDAFADVDLSSAIRDKIDLEPPIAVVKSKAGWRQSLGRLAIAVSLTLMVLVGVKVWDGQSGTQDIASAQNIMQGVAMNNDNLMAEGYNAVPGYGTASEDSPSDQLSRENMLADSVVRERFSAYIMQHAEQQSSYVALGVLPFVRAASFHRP